MSAGKQKRKQQRKQQKAQQSATVTAADQTDDRPAVEDDPLTPKTQTELQKIIKTRAWSVLPSCILALLRLNIHHQREIAIGLVFAVAFALLVLLSGWANSAPPAKKAKRWIALVSGTLVGCGLLWWFTVPAALTVIVTPPNISFTNQWDTYRFVVTNDLESDAYEVVVKFAYGAPPSDFKFDLPTSESKTLGEDIHDNDKGLKHTDAIGMSCRTLEGTYDTFITFYNLGPKERRTINVSRLKPGVVTIESRITYFSTVSKEFKSGPHITSQQSMADEDCTPVELSYGLK